MITSYSVSIQFILDYNLRNAGCKLGIPRILIQHLRVTSVLIEREIETWPVLGQYERLFLTGLIGVLAHLHTRNSARSHRILHGWREAHFIHLLVPRKSFRSHMTVVRTLLNRLMARNLWINEQQKTKTARAPTNTCARVNVSPVSSSSTRFSSSSHTLRSMQIFPAVLFSSACTLPSSRLSCCSSLHTHCCSPACTALNLLSVTHSYRGKVGVCDFTGTVESNTRVISVIHSNHFYWGLKST